MKNIMPILEVIAKHDLHSDLFWRCDGEYAPITFFLNTNDVFYWGTADAEELCLEDLPELERAIEDCEKEKAGSLYGSMLFACRKRGMRPQGAAYPGRKELWKLFDGCGPEREPDVLNPYRPGEYQSRKEATD